MAVNVEAMAKAYYDKGLWGIDQLRALVEKGKLSKAAYKRITGHEYRA